MSAMFNSLQKILFDRDEDAPGPSLDNMLEPMDRHMDNFDEFVPPAPESKPRTPFDCDVPKREIGLTNLSVRDKMRVIPALVPLFINMQRGARLYDGKFQPRQTHASPEFLAELEAMAKEHGAKDVAYIKVPNNAIFKDKGIPHQYAIIFTIEMDKEPIDTSPSFECQIEVMHGYKSMAQISMKLANHMRKHGFAAYPGTALGGLTDYPHLAELAGMGAIGYHGLLISPTEGARLRINTIYTNIENLPLVDPADNEHLWVRDFCSMCRRCVRECPVDAIYDEPKPRGDGGMQCIDHASCREFFTREYGCAVCVAVCPFSQFPYDKIKDGFKGNPNATQFQIEPIYLDDIPVVASDM